MTMTTETPQRTGHSARTARLGVYTAAAVLAALDLSAKAWANAALPAKSIDMGLIDLQLAYNPGVSFSVGASLPAWAVIALTGLITVAVAIGCWRMSPKANLIQRIGLSAILGGACANLIDRIINGHVTDYLHTGWWPTFNLADMCIVLGAACFAIGYVKAGSAN